MIKLNSSRVDYSKMKAQGEDIRFVDGSTNTELAYEIEKWDKNGDSFIWVKVPQVDGSSSSDYIYVYYGNEGAEDNQDAKNIWNDNYVMVQHLKESSGLTTTDSTFNENNGIKVSATSPTASDGKIAGAQKFNGIGSGDVITVNDDSSLNVTSGITLSLWVKPNTLDSAYRFLLIKNSDIDAIQTASIASPWCFFLQAIRTPTLQVWVGGVRQRLDSNTVLSTDSFTHLVATFDASTGIERIYINGALDVTANKTAGNIDTRADDLLISVPNAPWHPRTFDGTMDEIRISNTARSSDWISAQYSSMNDTFAGYGSEENQTGAIIDEDDESVFSLYPFTDNGMPTFTFKKAQDDTYELHKYQLFVDDELFIDFIPPNPEDKNINSLVDPDEKTFEDDEKYVYYTEGDINVSSKTKQLSDGVHKWYAKAINEIGMAADTQTKYLRINAFQSNLSGQFFPLTLSGISNIGNNLNHNWADADYGKTKTYTFNGRFVNRPYENGSTDNLYTIENPLFSFWGIAPFNSTSPTFVRTTIKDEKENQASQQTTKANENSIFGLNITNSLDPGEYNVTLESANDKGDYIQLPEFKLKINSPIEEQIAEELGLKCKKRLLKSQF